MASRNRRRRRLALLLRRDLNEVAAGVVQDGDGDRAGCAIKLGYSQIVRFTNKVRLLDERRRLSMVPCLLR